MQIRDLYDKYNLMPQLREHQLRVGGVVRLITNDHDSIVTTLVHDMGNIVKFDLGKSGLAEDELERWLAEQKQTREMYGTEAHEATYTMLKEVGMTKYVQYLKEEGKAYQRDDLDQEFFINLSKPALLTLYGDLRVGINGVTSIQGRIEDLESRYGAPRPESPWIEKLESYVQTLTMMEIKNIREEMVVPLFDELLLKFQQLS